MRAAISSNSSVWRDGAIVAEYARASALQAPEETILNQLSSRLSSMRMLDIGVGAGRTMLHFAPRVREYWGIDCSPEMIEACANRRPPSGDNISLAVCDAKAMTQFPEHFFDFVLFSYNGIDYMSHMDRLKTFAEVRRVSRASGVFCFSSHNLNDLHHLTIAAQFERAPRQTVVNLQRWFRLRFIKNKIFSLKRLHGLPYAWVNDGVHGNRLLAYYVNPAEQLKQLACYFEDVKVFRLNGARVDKNALGSVDDAWLYYLCTMR